MEELKKGQKAPDFTATDQSGNPIKLSNYKGSKVILYFYPNLDKPEPNRKEFVILRDGNSNYRTQKKHCRRAELL